MNRNNIEKVYYIKGSLKAQSPLIIGSGNDNIVDIECMRDWNGEIFIPGTVLAGNIRHLLENLGNKKIIEKYFGTQEENSNHSLFYFYDAYPEAEVKTSIRDGIKIDGFTRVVKDKSKYDYEVIEEGSAFNFRMEVIKRKDTDEKELEAIIFEIVDILKNSKLRIGAKSSRGFGKIRVKRPKICVIDIKKDKEKWINFNWENFEPNFSTQSNLNQDIFKENPSFSVIAKFKIPDSLIIRFYNSNPDDSDSVMMKNLNGDFIIPGTSWNGAIRHSLENIGIELGVENKMNNLLNELFGFVDESKELSNAIASKVIIEESKIKNAKLIKYTRNKVDRFTGGVVESALFDEMPIYEGEVELKCEIYNPEDWQVGLILLAIKEFENGFQTVGGGANIGRGRLELIDMSIQDEDKYFNALAKKLNQEV